MSREGRFYLVFQENSGSIRYAGSFLDVQEITRMLEPSENVLEYEKNAGKKDKRRLMFGDESPGCRFESRERVQKSQCIPRTHPALVENQAFSLANAFLV